MTSTARAVGFVDQLAPPVGDELLALGRRRRFRARATVLHEGDHPHDVVIVQQGLVKVSMNIDGREVVLDVLGAGDIAGELAVLDGRVRSASVVTVTAAELDVISSDVFVAFLAARPDAALTLLRCVSTRLRDASRRQAECGALDAVGRVCNRLLELAARYGRPVREGVRIDAPLTQRDIAAWAGLSREAVVKALQVLRRLGWVATTARGITVLDVDAVAARAALI
jgi:CRP/FNR family cyclic AMP-dependent transcriptional regulator